MLFQAGCYALLFLVCVLVLANVRSRFVRQATLLASSIALYLTWQPWFGAVLFTSIVINFIFGKWLRAKPHWLPLSLGIAFNLVLLGVFKYVPQTTAQILPAQLQEVGRLALPLGISFWTFQAMSYLFDLYREEDLDPTFLEFCLYMAFWPTVIMGPICRLGNMLPQFREGNGFSSSNLLAGIRRIVTGLFMKLVLSQILLSGVTPGAGVAAVFDGS